jgi:hypothetical protein
MIPLKLDRALRACADSEIWIDAIGMWNGRLEDSAILEGDSFVWGYGS